MSLQELQTMAAGIKNETRVGGNTAERVGKAFECVADVIQQGVDEATIKLDDLNVFPTTPQEAINFVKNNGKKAVLTVMDRDFSVGVLSIFADAQAQVLTEVFETRLTLDGGRFTKGHGYGSPKRYWRNYGIKQAYNGGAVKKQEWTDWRNCKDDTAIAQLLNVKELEKMYSFEVEDNFVASSQDTAFNNGYAYEIYRNIEKYPKFLVGLNFKKHHGEDRKIKLGMVDVLKKMVVSVAEITVQANEERVNTNMLVLPDHAILLYDGVLSYPFDYNASSYHLFGAVGSILSTASELVDLNTVKIQVLPIVKSYVDVNRLKKSPWEGKKIVVVGDSISDRSVYEVGMFNTGRALDPRSWVEVMRDELGCKVVNCGDSGHYMRYLDGTGFSATEAENTASGKLPMRSHYDTALLGNLDADLFIFEYGVNDGTVLGADQINSPISEDNRNSYTTGMNYVLSKLYEAKPNARCVFVSHWVNIRNIDKQIIAAQEAVAKKWNIPCVKWAELCGFSDIPCVKTATINGKQITFNTPQSTYSIMTMKGDATSATVGDMCHPFNDDARIALGTIVAREINSIF